MKRLLLIITILVVGFIPLFSVDTISSIKDLVSFGRANSNTLKSSYLELSKSEESIEGVLKLDSSRVSVTTQLENFNTSISIPVIDQISLSASLDSNLKKSVGVTIQPFIHSATRKNSLVSYKIQESNTFNTELQVEEDIIKSSLNWIISSKTKDLKEKEFQLQDSIYSEDKIRYEAGDITLDDLKDSLLSWSQARKSYLSAVQNLSTAEISIYSALGVKKGDVIISEITQKNLESELSKLKEEIDITRVNIVNTNSYLVSYYNLESKKNSLDSTWIYNPDLSANFNLSMDGENNPNFSASINFSLGLDDVTASDKKQLNKEYTIEESEHNLTVETLTANLESDINSLESSEINTEISKIEVEQNRLLLDEAKLLFDMGAYSELEYKTIELQYLNSMLSLYSSITEEYLNWLSLKKYI